MPRIILKPGKEKSVLRRHPWIFSGAIDSAPLYQEGDILPVYSAKGDLLAHAYFHPHNSIAGRILSFGHEPPLDALYRKIKQAIERRPLIEARRLINAEGDGIPGLVVDQYGNVLVMQVSTWGIERLKPQIIDALIEALKPLSIYEKSISSARKQEGLLDCAQFVYGPEVAEVTVTENGISLRVPIIAGQKTGLFLDQREMRFYVRSKAEGKNVLNCFAYTGAFSAAALEGKAVSVDSVEISNAMCTWMQTYLADPRHTVYEADVFDFLKTNPLNYELMILDPPAFAKKKRDVETACRGYKQINQMVFEKAQPKTLLLTSSCSSYISEGLFQDVVAQAASAAGREVLILGKHHQAEDHPISLFHPEGSYLKSLILEVQ